MGHFFKQRMNNTKQITKAFATKPQRDQFFAKR